MIKTKKLNFHARLTDKNLNKERLHLEPVINRKDDIMNQYKIKIVYHDLGGNISIENMWAEKYNHYYRIKNIPFFAPNIAYDDIIQVEEDNGELFFDEMITPSGNSTIQIIVFNISHTNEILKHLEQLGCGREGLKHQPYYAVNIPKDVDFKNVVSYLEKQNDKNILDYKVACVG